MSKKLCAILGGFTDADDNPNLCVKFPDAQKTCGGDSGGPLMYKPPDYDGISPGQNYELIGALSFGSACKANGHYESGFVKVNEHLDWIQKIISTTAFTTCHRK